MELKNNANATVTEPAATVRLSEDRAREIRSMDAAQIETRRAEINAAITTADNDALDAFEAELDALNVRAKELDAIETRRKKMRDVIGGGGTVMAKAPAVTERRTLESVIASEAYLNAFANDIKRGGGDDRECRALLTDLVEGGQVPIPTYIAEKVATDWQKLSILPRLRVTQLKSVANYPFEYSATAAAVHTEGAAAPAEETVSLGSVSVTAQMLKKWISYSHEVEALTGRAYIDYLYSEIEYRILKLAEDTAISVLTSAPATLSPTACNVPALTPSAFDAATIFNAQALLSDEAVNPVAIMNKQTFFNVFMALKDTANRPIYNVVPENGKPAYYLNGVPVLFSNALAAGANAVILVGDLDGLVCNLPEGYGVRFIADPYSLAEKDLTKIVGRMYAGFGLIRPNFFVKATLTA